MCGRGGGGEEGKEREERINQEQVKKKRVKKGNLGSERNAGFNGGQRAQMGIVQKNQEMKWNYVARKVVSRFREKNSDHIRKLGKKLSSEGLLNADLRKNP